jgi:hypothetical protein
MLDLDLFIPEEMTTAPEHPLAKNLELLLPDSEQASIAEIQKKHGSLIAPSF